MKFSLLLVLVLCSVAVYPTVSVSRWFSASFYDLRYTLRRYGHCTGDLYPLTDYRLNETEYLIHRIRVFLDEGHYEPDQLANVTALMDNICRSDIDQSYPISVHIDVNKFSNNHTDGKANRCQAIDDALDSMYYVFKRAALNRSEPLDFSTIQFYPNITDRSAYYNLTDLINTSWIKSETILEHVCNITDSIKRYVQARISSNTNTTLSSNGSGNNNKAADKRTEQQPPRVGVFTTIFDIIDRFLDPILGLQKRLILESNSRLELMQNRLSSGLGSIRDGFGTRIKSTRDRLSSIFTSSSNSTVASSKTVNATSGLQVPMNATNLTSASTMAITSTTTTMAPKYASTSPAAVPSGPKTTGASTSSNSGNNNKPTSPFVTNDLY